MRPLLLSALLLSAAIAGTAQAQELRGYSEPRFGTAAHVPVGWRSVPIQGQAGVSGHYFYSPDGATWIAVFGRTVPAGLDARRATTAADEQVTYRADGANWFVRSGFIKHRIFYRKAILSCGGRVAHLLAFEYPAQRKREHDGLVTALSHSLASSTAGC
jgi:hypothetical protein